MPILNNKKIPLSLYIHIPWCVKKCPYCDFNSHAATGALPEKDYVAVLMKEIDLYLDLIDGRQLISIFFGGGTPSLFSGNAIEQILMGVQSKLGFCNDIEITLEANPGTVDQNNFKAFRAAGVNRLSIGVQSFKDNKLKALGRIHNSDAANNAIAAARSAGFDNFNLDLMYGLPEQTIEEAIFDLQTAIDHKPTHISWYQLTLEPNTLFHRYPPKLPQEDFIWEMQIAGQSLLRNAGYLQYEVSAYAQANKECRHNRNYWEFGDYLGIGAGAHSKLSLSNNEIKRFAQVKHPKDFLKINKTPEATNLSEKDLIFEFMLNSLRLIEGVSYETFTQRTGLSSQAIATPIYEAQRLTLLENNKVVICATEKGQRYLNDLTAIFL